MKWEGFGNGCRARGAASWFHIAPMARKGTPLTPLDPHRKNVYDGQPRGRIDPLYRRSVDRTDQVPNAGLFVSDCLQSRLNPATFLRCQPPAQRT